MRRLRGLLVGDIPKNAELIKKTLTIELERIGCTTDWVSREDPASARSAVFNCDTFHFAILDLSLTESEMEDGVDVIEKIHRRDPRTFCLVVTGHNGWALRFRDGVSGYCPVVIDRDELLEAHRWSFEKLATVIRDHVSSVGLVEIGQMTYDSEDLAIVSLLDSIGRTTSPKLETRTDEETLRRAGQRVIRNLARRCLGATYGDDVSLELGYVVASKLGVHTCRLDVQGLGYPAQAFILKLSLGKEMLEREHLANLSASKILSDQALISSLGGVWSDDSGYHAIGARVAQDAVPLPDWLWRLADRRQARSVGEILLGEYLRPLYHPDRRARVPICDWIAPSTIEAMRGRAALERYASVISDRRAGRHGKADRELRQLRDLVETGKLAVPEGRIGSAEALLVMSFGNLYSHNVLVQPSIQPRPILIDASLFGLRHWAFDAAKLVVSLFLRVRRPGVEAMIWDDLEDSLESGLRLCPYQHVETNIEATPVDEFVTYCVSGLRRFTQASELGVLEEDWHWQWHAALAKEFLHQSSQEDLTPPRGVLAVLLASGHLRRSVALLKQAA